MAVYGIDLGTTNSVIARIVDGKPSPIPVDGNPIVPSVVQYRDDGEVVVGREARNAALLHPESTVRSIKRRMGREIASPILPGRQLTPEDVSAEILRYLKQSAEAVEGVPVRDVVITVPAYFEDAQRRATLAAGEMAGFNVLRLLNEPTAASLVYEHVGAAAAGRELLLMYDLGGGTFDVSVLETDGEIREVRGTAGNNHLGGDDFDEKLVRLFLDEVRRKHAIDLRQDVRAMSRLTRIAEETKIALSTRPLVEIAEEFLSSENGQPVNLAMTVERSTFEQLVEAELRSTIELTRDALRQAGVRPEEVTRICLVGGSTRIPRVRQLLEEAIPAEVHEEIDPDLCVGLGAAMQAGVIRGEAVDRILVDVASHSLGVSVLAPDGYGLAFSPIIPKNTVLPCTRAQTYFTAVEDQEKVEVEIYQGESEYLEDDTRVGGFLFDLAPSPVHTKCDVEFAYDLNGIVSVTVEQRGYGNRKTVALTLSQAHARDDAPHGAEARPAVEDLAARARQAAERVDPETRERILDLAARFEAAAGDERLEFEDQLLDIFVDLAGGDDDDDE